MRAYRSDNLSASTSSPNTGIGTNQNPYTPANPFSASVTSAWEATVDEQLGTYIFLNHTNKGQPYSFHPGTVNIALCDGSGQTLSETVDLSVFLNLMLRDDGQVLGEY